MRGVVPAAAWLLALAALAPARAAPPPDAIAVKADMVCNLAKFVRWPDAVMAASGGRVVVTVIGEDELAAAIAGLPGSRSVNGRPVVVRTARRAQDARGSQMVYIAASEAARAGEIVEALRGQPTLTLADIDGFASRGGMVGFTGTASGPRFEICLDRATRAGLRISSRLLALSHVVEPAP